MALDKIKLRNKRFKREKRREKIRKRNNREVEQMQKGDMTPLAPRHRRTLKDNRNHHRKTKPENHIIRK